MMDPIKRLNVIIAEAKAAIETIANETTQPIVPKWFLTAQGELGVKEARGDKHNERILEYLASCHVDRGGNLRDWGALRDETAWCSCFVNWCIERDETRQGTRNAMARSWLRWGQGLQRPRKGCIVVLERGAPGSGSGHVTFFDHDDQADPGILHCLGGNQKNSVCVAPYLRNRVIGYRWPTNV